MKGVDPQHAAAPLFQSGLGLSNLKG